MDKYKKIGKKGEIIAREYLKVRNYSILACNYRAERKEIDIIATKNNLLIFIEVKTRSSHYFGFPEEAVTPAKQENIKEVAMHYLDEHPEYEKIRFDIISITLKRQQKPEIMHFEDAFY